MERAKTTKNVGQPCVICGQSADAQATIAALQADNRTYINERHENMKQIEQLQADLAQRTAELEAVSNFIGVKYDAESKTWVSGQAPYLSAGTTKQEACIAAVDALRLACATWETKYRDLQAELERMSEQRCGTCKWWTIHDGQENQIDCATGDCAYPLPICLPDEYRITPYAHAGKDCPTWHAK